MGKSNILLTLLFFTYSDCYNSNPKNPVVYTKLGTIKGSLLESVLGKTIYSFRGIRYAEAPTGKLRFQPPVPIKKWSNEYDATKDGAACQQPFENFNPVSEDCLFLNVYTTKLPQHHHNPKRPVIFYMHPGGFYSFTGRSDWAGPQYLLEHDVVFVSINYRLATLGFISTGDCFAPGNLAHKDQVMALKWVNENIAAFGGNPDLITLIGYSAGSASITFHLVSPMARGLFHRGIVMSASGFGRGQAAPLDQLQLAKEEARLVGCPDDTSSRILQCLKTKSAEDIAGTFYSFQRNGFQQILLWQHVIEPHCGQERFLSIDPGVLLECKKIENVPIMAGITKKEFEGAGYAIADNKTLLKRLDENFDDLIPFLFNYEQESNAKYLTREIRKFYFGAGPLTREGLGKLYADGLTGYPINRAVARISVNSRKPVYYYRFDYEGRYSFYHKPGTITPDGVMHHDDLFYLIYISALVPIFNQTDPEFKMVERYTKMVVNFAITGNPTPTVTPFFDNVIWEPYNIQTKKYLAINDKLKMDINYYSERYNFWNKLYPIPKCPK